MSNRKFQHIFDQLAQAHPTLAPSLTTLIEINTFAYSRDSHNHEVYELKGSMLVNPTHIRTVIPNNKLYYTIRFIGGGDVVIDQAGYDKLKLASNITLVLLTDIPEHQRTNAAKPPPTPPSHRHWM